MTERIILLGFSLAHHFWEPTFPHHFLVLNKKVKSLQVLNANCITHVPASRALHADI